MGYYTQALETWFHDVILIRSNQEGFSSGENFCVIKSKQYHPSGSFIKNCARILFFGVNEMGKHRTRLKILENILSVINANERVKKTQIMYQAYLSYSLLTRYLNDVMEAGLVVCDNENCFWLTEKGENLLASFGEYYRSREVIEKNLNHIENKRSMLEEMCPNTGVATVNRATLEKNNKT